MEITYVTNDQGQKVASYHNDQYEAFKAARPDLIR